MNELSSVLIVIYVSLLPVAAIGATFLVFEIYEASFYKKLLASVVSIVAWPLALAYAIYLLLTDRI